VEIDHRINFHWFVALNLDEEVWDATAITTNRDRCWGPTSPQFFVRAVKHAPAKHLTSDQHFTGAATLLEARDGVKSFQPRDGKNPAPRMILEIRG
jgi:hypothetical protein